MAPRLQVAWGPLEFSYVPVEEEGGKEKAWTHASGRESPPGGCSVSGTFNPVH